ncbi:class I SAM-dependent methyltransferase [Candidatus Woesearchaeota archaeon]|nr:class I SAM-dependent methyltransferase [Candidatus Woesearchaeota archaeon]
MVEEDIWTRFTRSYTNVLSNWEPYRELVSKVLHYMAKKENILDQGCGTGIFSLELARMGKKVISIDNNLAMLSEAQAWLKQAMNGGEINGSATFMEGNAEALPFSNNTFDGIVANNVIFYVENPTKMTAEAYRVLKPDGVLVISGPKQNPDIQKLLDNIVYEFKQKGIYDALREDVEHFSSSSVQLKSTGIHNMYQPEEMVDLLTEAGFKEVIEKCGEVYLGQSYFVAVRK